MKTTSKLLIVIGFIFIAVGLGLLFSPIRLPHTEAHYMGPGPGTHFGTGFGIWGKGDKIAVNFTVSGGDEQINFHIEDPFRTTIYNETVKHGLDFTFVAENDGSYSLNFHNLQSESGKTITITSQRIVTQGLDTTMIGAGVIIVIMFGLGLFKIIFPEIREDIDT
ncbi:hypothetical protein ES703_34357 [subsurface metagenome]